MWFGRDASCRLRRNSSLCWGPWNKWNTFKWAFSIKLMFEMAKPCTTARVYALNMKEIVFGHLIWALDMLVHPHSSLQHSSIRSAQLNCVWVRGSRRPPKTQSHPHCTCCYQVHFFVECWFRQTFMAAPTSRASGHDWPLYAHNHENRFTLLQITWYYLVKMTWMGRRPINPLRPAL